MPENIQYKKHVWLILAIAVLGFLVYANALKGGFLWDDELLIIRNPDLKTSDLLSLFTRPLSPYFQAYYRPLQNLSFKLDYRLWHLEPFGFHLTNILIHIFNSLLVYILAYLVSRKKTLAFSAGVLFSVHTLLSEPVNYISSRSDLLVAFFCLLSVIFYLKIKGNFLKSGLFYFSLFSFALALLSKETAVILPLILLAWGLIFERKVLLKVLPYFGVAALYLFVRAVFWLKSGQNTEHLPLIPILLTDINITAIYLRLLILPIGLHKGWLIRPIISAASLSVILPALTILAGAVAWNILYKKDKVFSLGVLWFFIFLLPVLNIFFTLNAPLSEAWAYPASVGIFLAFASIVNRIAQKKRIIAYLIIALLVSFYALLTMNRNKLWAGDPEFFYQDILKYNPYDFTAHFNLGNIYYKKKSYARAEEEYKKTISLAPNLADAHTNLCSIYVLNNSADAAIAEGKIAVRLAPGYFLAHYSLGNAYFLKEEYGQAEEEYKKTLFLMPDFAPAQRRLEAVKQRWSEKK
ncbi:MAG: tetratricopeptide repeat protein [Candidatus Omnitrophica bacterium]|nr:tetratricopeptide repeat protein [Candidatus Omnitrophota bacterium]MDD5610735.1 tetratricopeptide repeat protein [Candidatus Omnitrophota bacterium]